MLEKQKDFIRVHPDSFYEEITTPQLKKEYERIDSPIDPNEDKAVSLLKHFQRKRTLVCWHDSSSISSASHFLVMMSTIYDPALFLTNEE